MARSDALTRRNGRYIGMDLVSARFSVEAGMVSAPQGRSELRPYIFSTVGAGMIYVFAGVGYSLTR